MPRDKPEVCPESGYKSSMKEPASIHDQPTQPEESWKPSPSPSSSSPSPPSCSTHSCSDLADDAVEAAFCNIAEADAYHNLHLNEDLATLRSEIDRLRQQLKGERP